MFKVVDAPIDDAALAEVVRTDADGAVVVFKGVARKHSRGREVVHLEYEAYPEMAEQVMAQIGDEITTRWPVSKVAMVHRTGVLVIGEASVVIALSSPHRGEAFAACQYAIDRLKQIVPIWKKEVWSDGSQWLGWENERVAAEAATAARSEGEIVVRPAQPGEYAAIGTLLAENYVGEGHASEAYAWVLRDVAARAAESLVLVAVQRDGSLVGTVTYAEHGTAYANTTTDDEAEFRMLVVDPSARRLGVGALLVQACIDRAREQGRRSLVLSTLTSMQAAQRLYERLGFRRTPERDWKPDPEMERPLLTYALGL